MDIKYVNPFIEAFTSVMPQLGFKKIEKGRLSVKGDVIKSQGVMLLVGMVGDVKGNVIYSMTMDNSKKVASTMMMGMPVDELNEMAQSALSELSNMLTANASANFEKQGFKVNISTPTLMCGAEIDAKMSVSKVLCIELIVDDIPVEIDIAIENM